MSRGAWFLEGVKFEWWSENLCVFKLVQAIQVFLLVSVIASFRPGLQINALVIKTSMNVGAYQVPGIVH